MKTVLCFCAKIEVLIENFVRKQQTQQNMFHDWSFLCGKQIMCQVVLVKLSQKKNRLFSGYYFGLKQKETRTEQHDVWGSE